MNELGEYFVKKGMDPEIARKLSKHLSSKELDKVSDLDLIKTKEDIDAIIHFNGIQEKEKAKKILIDSWMEVKVVLRRKKKRTCLFLFYF